MEFLTDKTFWCGACALTLIVGLFVYDVVALLVRRARERDE